MDPSEDIFSHLPPEIILNILSRVPIKAIFTCKCVCKSWLELLESPEFARSHLSNTNSVPGWLMMDCFVTNNPDETTFTIFEFKDYSPDEIGPHELHYKVMLELCIDNTSFGVIYYIEGSADGLLLLEGRTDHYVCNPITREYIELPKPDGTRLGHDTVHAHGFGATTKSEQYKAVMISHARVHCRVAGQMPSSPEPVCEVYTLGTGSWRSISMPSEMSLDYAFTSNVGKLSNGKLHWLGRDSTGTWWILCFDLETEAFARFRGPPVVKPEADPMEIGVLRDRLCFCHYSSKTEISLYVMNDCGGERESCWDVECVISRSPDEKHGVIYPVKAFADGDLLMVSQGQYVPSFSIYSNRTKTIAPVDYMFSVGNDMDLDAVLYTPTFVSLKGFEAEDVKVLESVRVTSGL